MSTRAHKQIILAAYLGGVNEHTLWEHPQAGSQIAFDSFRHLAQTAERGRFDYFFLAEGLALRERDGTVFDHDIAGRPSTLPVLAALAAVTEHIGLVGTLSATFNEPYELARQVATLDLLSGGRAGWNIVTSWDAFTGANFRRGGYLHRDQRYTRAEEFINLTRQLWDSWGEDGLTADPGTGQFLRDGEVGSFAHVGEQFTVSGRFTLPRSPQGRPVQVQAGVSSQGRDFAAATADVIFSPFSTLESAQPFYADIKARVAANGRHPDDVKIIPSIGFVLGDTEEEANELAAELRRQQLTDRTVQVLAEQVWNRDLSAYDPDGPVPDLPATPEAEPFIQGRALIDPDRHAAVARWQSLSREQGLSLREVVAATSRTDAYVGTPEQVADKLDAFIQNDGADGVVLGGWHTPHGLDEFVDRVVPLLQERGSLRTEYTGSTLRENLGISIPTPAALAATS